MSTVVLTPTHMAYDHTVVHTTFPHRSTVDCHHKKIFVHPNKNFAIGHVGEFDPAKIDRPETWDHMALLSALVLSHQTVNGYTAYHFRDKIKLADSNEIISIKEALDYYKSTFDFLSKTIIVTKDQRFVIKYESDGDYFQAKALGPYAGFGSGGMLAVGMLLGKMPLETIWGSLNTLDNQTSQEHTSIALSSLKSTLTLTNKRTKKS